MSKEPKQPQRRALAPDGGEASTEAAEVASLRGRVALLESENAALVAKVTQAEADAGEFLLMLDAAKVGAPTPSRVVRVRAADPGLRGMCLYGHQLTAEGFRLDVTGWSEKRMSELHGDPLTVVEDIA
jgi:hypothetical protein